MGTISGIVPAAAGEAIVADGPAPHPAFDEAAGAAAFAGIMKPP